MRQAHPRRALGGRRAQGQTAARKMLGRRAFEAVPFFWSQHYDFNFWPTSAMPNPSTGVEIDGDLGRARLHHQPTDGDGLQAGHGAGGASRPAGPARGEVEYLNAWVRGLREADRGVPGGMMSTRTKAANVQLKRAYEPAPPAPTVRACWIDRLWPRGVPARRKAAIDLWLKEERPQHRTAPVVRARAGALAGIPWPLRQGTAATRHGRRRTARPGPTPHGHAGVQRARRTAQPRPSHCAKLPPAGDRAKMPSQRQNGEKGADRMYPPPHTNGPATPNLPKHNRQRSTPSARRCSAIRLKCRSSAHPSGLRAAGWHRMIGDVMVEGKPCGSRTRSPS